MYRTYSQKALRAGQSSKGGINWLYACWRKTKDEEFLEHLQAQTTKYALRIWQRFKKENNIRHVDEDELKSFINEFFAQSLIKFRGEGNFTGFFATHFALRLNDFVRDEIKWSTICDSSSNNPLKVITKISKGKKKIEIINIIENTFGTSMANPEEEMNASQEEAIHMNKIQILNEEINKLPEKQKKALMLYLKGYSYASIKKRLSIKSVKDTIYHAKTTLRKSVAYRIKGESNGMP
jgi:hypothetical protein